jgi:diguanylate cyclase
LSVGLLDIDNFRKRLNDELGHSVGDEALEEKRWGRGGGRQDLAAHRTWVARHGGEEFAVLPPDTPVEEGQRL